MLQFTARIRSYGMKLRQAASTIFALTSIVPFLLFIYFTWRLQVNQSLELQIGLLLALLISILGFFLFRRLTAQLSALSSNLLGQATAAPDKAQPLATITVPGLGQVTEITEIAHAFGAMLAELRASTQRLEDLVFKLGTLNDLVEMAAKIPKIEDLLSHVLERSMRAVNARIGSIMLLDAERQTLRLAVSRGLEVSAAGAEVKVGEGIAGRVVSLGEAVLVENIETDPRFTQPNNPKYESGSFICLPLRVGDRIVGVVNLARKESGPTGPAPFTRTDMQFLNALGTYTAYAVDNARLFEEAQQAARRLRDVVEDQQLRLTLAQQQMVQAAKLSALGELVAGVAHELNNPLQVLVGASELLARQNPKSVETCSRMIREATGMAQRIVRGLLAFGRRMPVERSRVDLRELFDGVLALSVADLRLAGVTLEKHIAPDLPEVWADRSQIQQVLLNLITNAKQAMADDHADRRLRITMRRQAPDRPQAPERIEILLEDTGAGIPPDVLPRIFDPFVTTKGSGGTGLGLSISYGIVREHGGIITAESQQGRGTTFTIELPVGKPADATPDAVPASSLKGRRLLIVGDDDSMREILLGHLEGSGCLTSSVASADVGAVHAAEADLVVVDYDVDNRDWDAIFRSIVGADPDVGRRLLFLISGPVHDGAQPYPEEIGAIFLLKPFTRERFLEAAGQALRQRPALQESASPRTS